MSTEWAAIDDPELAARDFAKSVLAFRLEVIEALLPLAAYHHADDVEHVHRLRVACRRASAALRAFEPLMKRKPRALKRWLSMIRDAAGPARDIDVLLERFAAEDVDEVTEYAVSRLVDERVDAQQHIIKVARRATRDQLQHAAAEGERLLTKKKANKNDPTLNEFGRAAMRQAYEPFSQLAHIESPTIDQLHELRIAGKRVRYSLELFDGLWPADVYNKAYGVVERLQKRLGAINDHATAQQLYQKWLGEMPADATAARLAARVVQEHRQTERLARRFLDRWHAGRATELDALFAELC